MDFYPGFAILCVAGKERSVAKTKENKEQYPKGRTMAEGTGFRKKERKIWILQKK